VPAASKFGAVPSVSGYERALLITTRYWYLGY